MCLWSTACPGTLCGGRCPPPGPTAAKRTARQRYAGRRSAGAQALGNKDAPACCSAPSPRPGTATAPPVQGCRAPGIPGPCPPPSSPPPPCRPRTPHQHRRQHNSPTPTPLAHTAAIARYLCPCCPVGGLPTALRLRLPTARAGLTASSPACARRARASPRCSPARASTMRCMKN